MPEAVCHASIQSSGSTRGCMLREGPHSYLITYTAYEAIEPRGSISSSAASSAVPPASVQPQDTSPHHRRTLLDLCTVSGFGVVSRAVLYQKTAGKMLFAVAVSVSNAKIIRLTEWAQSMEMVVS
ncbi:hypothetical protein GWK47_015535 [Chionoecetes opilio]|uniref:Uncharacterized protein n=1 Tax=Chionoecetes opilio TaxID=41210 RepID=A0A8J5CIB1_CHIOP|nr:hypothetical protein GWK47_015535 [Chionoecetes opilio]